MAGGSSGSWGALEADEEQALGVAADAGEVGGMGEPDVAVDKPGAEAEAHVRL